MAFHMHLIAFSLLFTAISYDFFGLCAMSALPAYQRVLHRISWQIWWTACFCYLFAHLFAFCVKQWAFMILIFCASISLECVELQRNHSIDNVSNCGFPICQSENGQRYENVWSVVAHIDFLNCLLHRGVAGGSCSTRRTRSRGELWNDLPVRIDNTGCRVFLMSRGLFMQMRPESTLCMHTWLRSLRVNPEQLPSGQWLWALR